MDLAVEGVACGACIARIESAVQQAAGRHRRAAQFHQSPAARGLGRRRAQAGADHQHAGEHRLSRPSLRAAARRRRRGRRSPPPHALSGGRRLCRHERHAAVGVGVVGQCHRHHAGDARLLPLGLGADRAAGGGLCRPAVLQERLARAARRARSTWTCRSRSASRSRSPCRWWKPPITRAAPISIPPSCCCSSC